MSCGCGCCEGVQTRTPVASFNPPGRSALTYRMGNHAQFRETMLARLSSQPALRALTTREPDDPAIALLDCWAVVGDVLTFYTERIVNEGFLRTATEPRSLTELGRLVGHTPRPALGSTTHLAYTLDPGARTVIPAGSSARSVPAQDELPQTFETTEEIEAREEWNSLALALTRPPQIRFNTGQPDDVRTVPEVTVSGTTANLKQGDRLLFLFGATPDTAVRTVLESTPDFPANATRVRLSARTDEFADALAALGFAVSTARSTVPAGPFAAEFDTEILAPLADRVAANPTADDLLEGGRNSLPEVLDRIRETSAIAHAHESCAVIDWFGNQVKAVLDAGDVLVGLAIAATASTAVEIGASRRLARTVLCPPCSGKGGTGGEVPDPACDRATALVGLTPILPALRREPSRPPRRARDFTPVVADLFRPDSDVLPKILIAADRRLAPNLHKAWANETLAPPSPLTGLQVLRTKARVGDNGETGGVGAHSGSTISLDAVYDGILPGSFVSVESAQGNKVARVAEVSQGVLNVTVDQTTVQVPVTVLGFDETVSVDNGDPLWAQGEPLTALGEPNTDPVTGAEIELARLYDGLKPGRRLVISGERTDIPHTSGIQASELTMVGGIRQQIDPDLPGDTVRTFLTLATPLSFTYRRDTVRINGNVAEADQGETRNDVLGSGDAGQTGQTFKLRQVNATNPLTALPADNPLGAADTLTTRVDGVRWNETDELIFAGPTEHAYELVHGADGSASVVFGDGVHGARVPTGQDNVTATYRTGAGHGGNVVAGQINQLGSRPLGVNAVVNPLPATGGADGDGPGDARATIPLRMLALDRLVSVRDYEDFTRARAGIGKAGARKLSDGTNEVVHVTIAGIGDVPIDPLSGLFGSLEASLTHFGDLGVPVRVAVRELVLLVLDAGIKILPDFSYDLVEPRIRAAVLDEFSFARRQLGETAFLSQAIAAIQSVPGVDYVDVDVFHGVPSTVTPVELATLVDGLTAPEVCVPASPARFEEVRTEVMAFPEGPETLTELALRTGLTVDELLRLNPAQRDTGLSAGQSVIVSRGIRPAQLAVLPADLPEALTLRRIP